MKLNEVLSKTIQFFKDKKIESARLDAELLIAHALKIPRIQLYVKYDSPLNESEINLCREFVKRRSNGEPVAYIIEEKGFYGFSFKVKPGVLIPRPETELIVDEVLKDIKIKHTHSDKIRILDLGAGTGCIGLSIAKNNSSIELISVEKSVEAFEILKQNVELLNLESQVQLILNDVDNLNPLDLGVFDYIVSNPPYIAENDPEVEPMVKRFEPSEALFTEDNGLKFLKSWAQKFRGSLKVGGLIYMEMGYKQGQQIVKYYSEELKYSDAIILKDLSGLDRIIKARA